MLHNEVTAASLVKVDMRGDILSYGSSRIGLGINKIGFSLHAAVYASRPDIKCIVHLRCCTAVAVSVFYLFSFLFKILRRLTLQIKDQHTNFNKE